MSLDLPYCCVKKVNRFFIDGVQALSISYDPAKNLIVDFLRCSLQQVKI